MRLRPSWILAANLEGSEKSMEGEHFFVDEECVFSGRGVYDFRRGQLDTRCSGNIVAQNEEVFGWVKGGTPVRF